MEMMKRNKKMLMTEEMPLQPLLPRHHLLRPLPLHLKRSMKKALWG
jgi:hypothetical protein